MAMDKEIGLIVIVIVIGWVDSSHIPPGCLRYKYKKNLHSTNTTIKDAAQASQSEFCKNAQLISHGMEGKRRGDNAQVPFLIHTFNYTNSNAIRVKVRGKKGGERRKSETLIEECILQARTGDGQVIGKFYPYPSDVQLNCCQNILDLNTARILRMDPTHQNSSLNFIWIPSGYLDDFKGPFKFIVSILNGEGEYWSFESGQQFARKSVKLEESAETQPPEIPHTPQ